MRRKLFALESEEVVEVLAEGGADPVEMELAEQVPEVEAEQEEIQEDVEAIQEGSDAADQLEEVSEVVEASLDSATDGEGLPPVAAEAVRIAVEAIAARIGYNGKTVYQLYATENFKSASSRRANTELALEGIKEFLTSIWKRIKEAVAGLVARVRAFWDKHFSVLSRSKKALEALKAKVEKSTGEPKDKATVENTPSSIANSFATNSSITVRLVQEYVENHKELATQAKLHTAMSSKLTEFIGKLEAETSAADASVTAESESIKFVLAVLAKIQEIDVKQLVGGVSFTGSITTDLGDRSLTAVNQTSAIIGMKDKPALTVPSKAELTGIISGAIEVVDVTSALNKEFTKSNDEVKKQLSTLDSLVKKVTDKLEKTEGSDPEGKVKNTLRDGLAIFNRATSYHSSLNAAVLSYNIKLAKATYSYGKFCLAQYK